VLVPHVELVKFQIHPRNPRAAGWTLAGSTARAEDLSSPTPLTSPARDTLSTNTPPSLRIQGT
jgi:hypothetical protein